MECSWTDFAAYFEHICATHINFHNCDVVVSNFEEFTSCLRRANNGYHKGIMGIPVLANPFKLEGKTRPTNGMATQ